MPSVAACELDLYATLSCGQAFRWRMQEDGWWCGVVNERNLRVKHVRGILEFEGEHTRAEVESYFALDHDLPAIYDDMLKTCKYDEHLSLAIKSYYGLRILRQEPWEALASFIVSANNNISRISRIIEKLSQRFGEPIDGWQKGFPAPSALGGAAICELKECGLGYRASQLRKTALSVNEGKVNLGFLKKMPLEMAREELLSSYDGSRVFPGVGEKVADCVLLFGLGFLSAVSVDTNVNRLWDVLYSDKNGKGIVKGDCRNNYTGGVTPSVYRNTARGFLEKFGKYSGYAQQYLFHWWRCSGRKRTA